MWLIPAVGISQLFVFVEQSLHLALDGQLFIGSQFFSGVGTFVWCGRSSYMRIL